VFDVVVVGGVFREILDGDTVPRSRLGGSALIAAILASRFGASTSIVSYVGEEDADAVTAMLRAASVDIASLAVVPGASGTFVFPTRPDPPWPMYRPAEAVPQTSFAIPDAKMYLVFGIPDIDPVALGWLSAILRDAHLVWDRQGWLSRARNASGAATLPPRSKTYVANFDEAIAEFRASDEDELIELMPPGGFQSAVVKRGRAGCTLVQDEEGHRAVKRLAAFVVDPPNTIGSGDAFAGALAARMSQGLVTSDAVLAANAAASAFLTFGGDPLAEDLVGKTQALLERVQPRTSV
jgi:sugar/nucleoside kinase (ribokinase family)